MALQISKTLYVNFVNLNPENIYNKLLTAEQLQEIQNPIEKSYTINGIYAKIGEIAGGKDTIGIRLDLYTDNSKLEFLESKNYIFNPNLTIESNFIKQGYDYLKTLEEYKDAVDLLDE